MAYIVDFTIIMRVIFGLTVSNRLPISRRLIKLAFVAYSNSRERIQVRIGIRDYVKLADRTDDAALAEMLRLIMNYQMETVDRIDQMETEDIHKLTTAMRGFYNVEDEPRDDNVEDEPWDVCKA